jgi:hypothetical protein
MKKIIIALGLALITSSAFAHHTAGLAAHQARQAATANSSASQGALTPTIPSAYVTRARRPNIISDPQSCVKRFGEHCVLPDNEPVSLDLGDTDLSKHDIRTTKPE